MTQSNLVNRYDVSILEECELKKIIIFASFAPSLLLFRAHLIQALLDQGCAISVLAPRSTCSPEFMTEFQRRFPNVAVLKIDMSLHGMNPFKDLQSLFKLKALFKKEKPDIVLSYTIKPVIYGSIAACMARVPNVFSMITGLGTTFDIRGRRDALVHVLVKILYRQALKGCCKVIFQNNDDANLFKKLKLVSQGQLLCVNGSGVDIQAFHLMPLPKKISFIFIGRLIIEKGIREFMTAAERIHVAYPEVVFHVVGDIFKGHPRSLSAADYRILKTKPYFNFVGQVDDVQPSIQKSTVMVLPSYREGTPRSVLEAMSMGRAIITTDTPGCRETVVDGVNGFLVPVKDVDALVEKMEYFIQNPAKCQEMGLESRKLAERKFDVHAVNTVIIKAILGE